MTKRTSRIDLLAVAALQHGLFTTTQARMTGLSRAALDRWAANGEIRRVSPGVWHISGSPETPERMVLSGVLGRGADAVLATTSAGWLWEIPGHRVQPVRVIRPRETHTEVMGVQHTSRLLDDEDRTVRRGIPVTTPVRTVFDLAGRQHELRTRRDLNCFMGRGLITLEQLDCGLDRLAARGRTGIRVMRRLIIEAHEKGVPAGSNLELVAEEVLEWAGYRNLQRQVEIGDELGRIARVDFAHRRHRVVFEVDSDRYHGGLVDRMIDEGKTIRLERAGWHVVRITEHEVWWDRTALVTRLRNLRFQLASQRPAGPAPT